VSARRLLAAGLIEGAVLRLEGEMIVIGASAIESDRSRARPRPVNARGASRDDIGEMRESGGRP